MTSLLLLSGFSQAYCLSGIGLYGQPVMLVGMRGTQRKSPSVQNFCGF